MKANNKKQQNVDSKKAITVKTDNFNQRFILMLMNKYAPKGYKFVITGPDRRIAMYSSEIMGTQSPRGAFVSDLSFDLIEGVYGGLFKHDLKTFNSDIVYWRMRSHLLDKPYRTTKEKHERYIKTLEKLSNFCAQTAEFVFVKRPPMKPFAKNNAILVQGIMDSGKVAPDYLQKRMHNIVNEVVWWSFNRAMRDLRASKLAKYRNIYKKTMAEYGIIPGAHSGCTMWCDKIEARQRIYIHNRLDVLRYDLLPSAIEKKDNVRVLEIKKEIESLEKQLDSDYITHTAPARDLLRDTFYVKREQNGVNGINISQTVARDFSKNMSAIKQFWLMATAKQKNK